MALRDHDLVPERKKSTKGSIGVAILLALLVGFGIRLIVHRFFFTPVKVSEAAMAPTLQQGDVVTVHRRIDAADIQRDRILWMVHPMNDSHRLFRRVVAVAGDVVKVDQGAVYVNGVIVRESPTLGDGEAVRDQDDVTDDTSVDRLKDTLKDTPSGPKNQDAKKDDTKRDRKEPKAKKGPSPAERQAGFFDRPEFKVADGQVYVLAETAGLDSRHFGVVPLTKILGWIP